MRGATLSLLAILGVASCQSTEDSEPSASGAKGGMASSVAGKGSAAAGRATGGRAASSGGTSSGSPGTGGGSGRGGSVASGGGSVGGGSAAGGTSAGEAGIGTGAASGSGGNAGSDGGSNGDSLPIGEWTDAPGECPAGSVRADITTVDEMESASRGESNEDATCFFVHDGSYDQNGSTLPLYFRRGGSAGAPVVWVGESRAGVKINGRATFEVGADHLVLSNMTFDISGLTEGSSYNTITVLASDISMSHLTLTSDCAHGSTGGHIEVPGQDDSSAPRQTHVVIDSCLIENFGHCGPDGALDHGIYLSSGDDIVVRNSVIRGNSSRGIQIYTHYEDSSLTLTNVLIEQNRIESNGHADYQDGMVINGNEDTDYVGPIDGVTIRHNIFWHNRYSAIRFVGNSVKGVEITHNTFVEDGADSTSSNRSELNLDDGTPVANVSKNLFAPANTLVNSCVDTLAIDDNAIFGGSVNGSCVGASIDLDPEFVDAANGDFHTKSPLAAGYGAYAP